MKATWRSVNSGRRLPTLGALGIQPIRAAEFKIAFFFFSPVCSTWVLINSCWLSCNTVLGMTSPSALARLDHVDREC